MTTKILPDTEPDKEEVYDICLAINKDKYFKIVYIHVKSEYSLVTVFS